MSSQLGSRVLRHFAPREVIIRSGGKIKYIRLSTRSQLLGATLLAGIAGVSLATSVGLAIQQLTLHSRDIAVRQAEDAYSGLLAEVTDYFDQFKGSTDRLDDDEAFLLGLSKEDGSVRDSASSISAEAPQPDTAPAAGTAQADTEDLLREKLRVALQQKLLSFDSDLQKIAARNQSLNGQIVDLKLQIRGLSADRHRLAQVRDDLAARLARGQQENGALTQQVAQLTGALSELQAKHDAAAAKVVSLDVAVATLRGQLTATNASNLDLSRQVAQTQRALETVIAQRNTLQTARADMAGTIGDLKERLASIQESQANFVANVTERTRQNLEDMEKTVDMTGLNVDKLLQVADQTNEGQGGPFVPAATDLKDAGEQKLLESVATLDDEVGRWERLQVILRSIPLTAPVDQYYISSGFGRRTDPINGQGAVHEGLDMVDTIRSDVMSTAPGTVVFAGWRGNYGRVVEIDHGLGVHTLYAHLDSVQVKEGDVVDYRQVIGKLGNSGRSSGLHVHYEVRFQDRPLDPMGFLRAGRYVFKG